MTVHIPEQEDSYELIDSGRGERLERFGEYTVSRPDPEALWEKSNETLWQVVDAVYTREGKEGSWEKNKEVDEWNISYGGINFDLRLTGFKHVGLFPEQKAHWQWLEDRVEGKKVLNLFAYTGGATLAASKAGAEVVHVDASKGAIEWARKNAELTGVADNPIRWIHDDVLTFLKREVKRGNTYDVVVMDPPVFGSGGGNKVWKIEKDFYELFSLVKQVLSENPTAVIVHGYTAGYSPLSFLNNVKELEDLYGGTTEHGELALKDRAGRLLSSGVFARWSK